MLGLLVVVLYGHRGARSPPGWIACLPALNAALNATSASFLALAYRAVRRRAFVDHARHMLRALLASAAFLVSYRASITPCTETRRLRVTAAVRPVYFFILITHVGLSAVALPLIHLELLSCRCRAATPMHKRLSRYTLPIWLYVSDYRCSCVRASHLRSHCWMSARLRPPSQPSRPRAARVPRSRRAFSERVAKAESGVPDEWHIAWSDDSRESLGVPGATRCGAKREVSVHLIPLDSRAVPPAAGLMFSAFRKPSTVSSSCLTSAVKCAPMSPCT
jgi:putative membrane protein